MVHLIENDPGARIKVVGAGGCGGNAINHMIASGLQNVEFVSVNTDSQALRHNTASIKLQIGQALTRGRGAGGNPEIGRKAALEDEERLRKLLADAEMVFVTAGMGGGTGTGSVPVIARFARESGALTVGVVTKPFLFEGRKRKSQAEEGVRQLKDAVDTLITIPNDRLLSVASRTTSMTEAFQKADDVLLQAVRGISELVTVPGLINLDFADVRSVMADMGMAMMGMAYASGENRAVEAAQKAISSPLLEDMSIKGARGLLISLTGGSDMSLFEVHEAASLIQEEAHEDANIIFGAVIDEQLSDEIQVTVIATGFGEGRREPERRISRYSPSDFGSRIRENLGRQIEDQFANISAGQTVVRPEEIQEDSEASPSEIPFLHPVESPCDQIIPVADASPAPSESHNAVVSGNDSFNGNGKPVRRLGLVDDKILDIAAFKQLKIYQPEASGRNQPESVNDFASEQNIVEPQFADSDIHGRLGMLQQSDSSESPPNLTVEASRTIAPGGTGLEVPAKSRQMTRLERRALELFNQLWSPTKMRR
jgi:cell division protein FtsZ